MRVAQALGEDPASATIRADDIRFGHMIRRLDPRARNADAMALNLLASSSPGPSRAASARLERFHHAIQAAKTLTLEAELAEFLAPIKSTRNQAIFARVQGWDGGGGCTLEAAGSEFGITKERVRQICASSLEVLRAPQFAPVLDSVLAFIASHPGLSEEQMEAALGSERLIGGPFRLEGVLNAAEVFERKPGFKLHLLGGRRLAMTEASCRSLRDVLRTAQVAVSRNGGQTYRGSRVPSVQGARPGSL